MSAECPRCGADITYPEGSWPVGRCEPCDLRAERDRYREALERIASHVHCGGGAWDENRLKQVAREALVEPDFEGEVRRQADLLGAALPYVEASERDYARRLARAIREGGTLQEVADG